MIAVWAILAAVVVQRLVEVAYASRNTAALVRAGAVEVGRGHYPAMVALHTAWLVTIAIGIARCPELHPAALVAYAALQPLRVWIMATLGRFWTTRVITIKDAPLVRRGPYRYLRHPNYVVVVGEVALLPLGFGQVATAVVFSAANLALLAWRIHVEQAALAPRTSMPGP